VAQDEQSGGKWWIKVVAVPLLGGVVAIIVALINRAPRIEPVQTQPATIALEPSKHPSAASATANKSEIAAPAQQTPVPPVDWTQICRYAVFDNFPGPDNSDYFEVAMRFGDLNYRQPPRTDLNDLIAVLKGFESGESFRFVAFKPGSKDPMWSEGCCTVLDNWLYKQMSYSRPTIVDYSSLTRVKMIRDLARIGLDESVCAETKPGVRWISKRKLTETAR
jgi:hypothetical protein